MKEVYGCSSRGQEDSEHNEVVFPFERDGNIVGKAILDFFSDGEISFYFLTSLKVEDGFKNQRVGTSLLKKVNTFLEEQETLGLLINFIPEDTNESKSVHEIYSKNGWKEIGQKGTNVYVFQPKSIGDTQVDRLTSVLIEKSEFGLL